MPQELLIVGAGIFGVTAALAARRRGYAVTLVDPGPIPHPLAASTDVSKVCRMEYGADEPYMAWMESAREGWLAWNAAWRAKGEDELYDECGVLMVARRGMEAGGYEHESFELLRKRGHAPERLDAKELARRFPAWSTGAHVDGFFHAKGGYARSGHVVAALAREARDRGCRVREGFRAARLREDGRAVVGESGEVLEADALICAAGSWTHVLVPELAPHLRATGHAVFHLRPRDESLFRAERFPVFTADIARTGFYGFPLHPLERVVKIALHDRGVPIDPDAPREFVPEHERRLRAFLPSTFPALAEAEIVFRRLCLYSDTRDEDFWIAAHPEKPGLVVAAGGSGHAFKFAPRLGDWIVDAVEGRANETGARFRWRLEEARGAKGGGKRDDALESGGEAARCHGH